MDIAQWGHGTEDTGPVEIVGRKLRWDPAKEQFLNDPQATRMLTRPMRSPWHM